MWELLSSSDPFSEYPVANSGFMSVLEDEIIAGLRYAGTSSTTAFFPPTSSGFTKDTCQAYNTGILQPRIPAADHSSLG